MAKTLRGFRSRVTISKNTLAALLTKAQQIDPASSEAKREATTVLSLLEVQYPEICLKLEEFLYADPPVPDLEETELHQAFSIMSGLHSDIFSIVHPIVTVEQTPLSPNVSSSFHSFSSQAPGLPQDNPLVNMPRLQIPKFSGLVKDWEQFFSRFESLIGSNSTISDVHKFQYLLESLEPISKSLVSHLSLTSPNYCLAIKLLKDKYDNPRRVITHHATEFLNIGIASEGNRESINKFLDCMNSHFKAIEVLEGVDPYKVIVHAFLLSRLDKRLLSQFHPTLEGSVAFPTMEHIHKFLSQKLLQWENTDLLTNVNWQTTPSGPRTRPRAQAYVTSPPQPAKHNPVKGKGFCSCCKKEQHFLYYCPVFRTMSILEKNQHVKETKACYNCLGQHPVSDCLSTKSCKHCGRRHHSMLHWSSSSSSSRESKTPSKESLNSQENRTVSPEPKTIPPAVLCAAAKENSCVLLATSVILLECPFSGQVKRLRAVIDTAAAASFVRSDCAESLGLSIESVITPLGGLGRMRCKSTGTTRANVRTRQGNLVLRGHSFYILSSITFDTPMKRVSSWFRKRMYNQNLADPEFDIPAPLECILGADAAAVLITGTPTSMGAGLPVLLPSVFGDIILGQAPVDTAAESHSENQVCISTPVLALVASTRDPSWLHNLIEKFWKSEEPPTIKPELSVHEENCEKFYRTTTTRNSKGEYVVRLPFIAPQCPELVNSFVRAHSRFLALERRFAKDPEHYHKYVEFMRDYKIQGHMVPSTGPNYYFIPHHGIYKKRGDTSKLRVVFNASAPTKKGISLNDVLFAGPKLHSLIPDVITLFRLFPFVFTCDIKQMFRAIHIHPSDYPYQCILWRESPQDPLKVYYLTTVTYGSRSAPYLANRTIKQLSIDEAERFPKAAKVLQKHIFVDDIAIGAYTLSEAKALQAELLLLLQSGGFILSKWQSNCSQLLPLVNQEVTSLTSTSSVLGMIWYPKSDELAVNSNIVVPEKHPTKRSALSLVAQIFDPCGFITPFVFKAKTFVQKLWANKLDWDSPLPEKLLPMWSILVQDLSLLSCCRISRSFPSRQSQQEYFLHGFCDASQQGSAAVLYLVSVESGAVSFLTAKSRVAPLQTQTIPRLELVGAYLLAQLTSHYSQLLLDHLKIKNVFLWSDSQIVLNWLHTPPHKLKIFEANRVSQIQSWLDNACWSYVPSSQNPADVASRGASLEEVSKSPLWCYGPSWLSKTSSEWPQHPFITCQLTVGELCNDQISQPKPKDTITALTFINFSSWTKIISVYQWVLAWSRKSLPTYSTIVQALCYAVQNEAFKWELTTLKKGGSLPLRFRRLDPFIDSYGLIRVGGRLQHSHALVSTHPIILPKQHPLVNLLILHYHTSFLHAGCATVLAQLRHWFWILGGRQAVRSVLSKCVTCFRARPRQDPPKMGNLPSPRVNIELPFTNTGMDFAGPFLVKSSHLRKAPLLKVYVCVFICFSTTAVHLEVATGLSTSDFIDSLKRFISRRGTPKTLYSDCGTNFVGASTQLKVLLSTILQDKTSTQIIKKFALQNNISFQFNPPATPHQGGLWERAISSMKRLLSRMLRNDTPSLIIFVSLINQIEGILNSRPLTPMSADPRDLEALTPSHFLIGRSVSALPETDVHPLSCNTKGYKMLKAYLSTFWSQWRTEYLPLLQPRSKWTSNGQRLEVGDLVVLAETGVASCHWPLGRVKQIFPGADGIVRKVLLTTSSGEYIRPATKVFKLPLY